MFGFQHLIQEQPLFFDVTDQFLFIKAVITTKKEAKNHHLVFDKHYTL